jgi:hypothetical protein
MNTLATSSVAAYSQAVREALHDLTPAQARTMLDGLDEHLAEVAEDGATDLEAVLGPPAAYAAELRAAAGRDATVPPKARPAWDPPASPSPADDGAVGLSANVASAGPSFVPTAGKDLVQTAAGVFLVFVFGLLAIITIRQSRPLNGLKIIFAILVAGGMFKLLQAAARKADLPEPFTTWLPRAIVVASVMTAVLIAGSMAQPDGGFNGYDPAYDGRPTTVFATIPNSDPSEIVSAVPNVVGMISAEAIPLLQRLRFNVTAKKEYGDVVPADEVRVTHMEPAAGTVVDRGSSVLITLSRVPASPPTQAPTPTIAATPTTAVVSPSPQPTPVTASATTVAPTTPPTVRATPAATAFAPASSTPSSAPTTATPATTTG